MIANVLLVLYLFCAFGITLFAFSKIGKELQWRYLAFKDTQRYMHSKGLKWPPREGLD